MSRQSKYHLDIEIDRLSESILNTISGDSFATEIHQATKADLQGVIKAKGWKFSWLAELKQANREVYKLTIVDNPDIIQGLISISDFKDHYFLHLIESASFNLGKKKLYEGVPGNLVAFVCKQSWDRGYEGFVAFYSKTKLIEHYSKSLGATHVGGQKMIIFPHAALNLITKYFKS